MKNPRSSGMLGRKWSILEAVILDLEMDICDFDATFGTRRENLVVAME